MLLSMDYLLSLLKTSVAWKMGGIKALEMQIVIARLLAETSHHTFYEAEGLAHRAELWSVSTSRGSCFGMRFYVGQCYV